jgi:hypothetical protein
VEAAGLARSGTGNDPLCAGGTLSLRPLSVPGRLWLTIEMAVIFLGAPLAVWEAVHSYGIPVFIALLPVLAVVLGFLLADPTFSLRREFTRGFGWTTLLSILAVFVIGGGAVALYVAEMHPAWFLELPRERPETYAKIMLLYPAMSVAVQELVYRTFYFHRYGALLGGGRWLGILLNGALFGFGHIVIGSEFAILATLATGTLFAIRYALTRAYWAVFLEHTLWGALVFTVGLGPFFFTGVSILSWR